MNLQNLLKEYADRIVGGTRAIRNPGKRSKEEEEKWSAGSNFRHLFKKESWTFDPSIHSASQARDRRPEFEKEDWTKLHQKVFWAIKDNKLGNGVYLFYSKSMEQGYVAQVSKPKVKIITVLPRGAHNASMGSDGTTRLQMMEFLIDELLDQGIFISESMEELIWVEVDNEQHS